MSKDIATLRAEAKELGINTFGMGKDAIAAAIAEKQGTEEAPEPLEELEEEPAQKAAPATAATVDPTLISLLAAQKMVEEAMAKLAAMQPAKKEGTPEEVISAQHTNDKMAIQSMEKVPVFIPTYPGAPRMFTSTVNGHRVEVIPGKEKMVPKAHAENIYRSFERERLNEENRRRKEQEATKLL